MTEMAVFFERAKGHFGEKGAYQSIDYLRMSNHRFPVYFDVWAKPEMFIYNRLNGKRNVKLEEFCQDHWLTNVYGDDSLVFYPTTNETIPAYSHDCDTSFYVTEGFSGAVVARHFAFVNSNPDKPYFYIMKTNVYLTADILENELPVIVYGAVNGYEPLEYRRETNLEMKVENYARYNNPLLREFYFEKRIETQVLWYDKLTDHSLDFKIVNLK